MALGEEEVLPSEEPVAKAVSVGSSVALTGGEAVPRALPVT